MKPTLWNSKGFVFHRVWIEVNLDMNLIQEARFEEALARNREKWVKIMDPEVNYHFPIPKTSMKEMFLNHVNKHPDKVYIYHKDRVCTYGEMNAMAVKLANGMLELGLKKGDRVITYVSNGVEFVALAQACFKSGIIMVNTNPRSTADEIQRRVDDCTPELLIADSDAAEAVIEAMQDGCGRVKKVFFCPALEKENRWAEFEAWDKLFSENTEEPDVEILPEDIAILQYTGGTTGVLKGCCQTNHAFVAKALAQVQYFKPILTEEDEENYMVMIGLGMSHAFGFGQGIVVNMSFGGAIFFADSLDEILSGIEKFRPTVWPSVPLWMKLIASDPQYQSYDITSLKCITCGSAPLPVEVIDRVEKITGAVITEGYGMTETVNTIAINDFKARRVGTVGVPNPNIEYLIVDQETGTEVVNDGECGEIICRGECVMKQYWNNPTETAHMLRDGWLYTGDIGRMDEDGYLIIMDRKKDLIITGGFNVFPSEIEAIAMTAPNVADAIAIGVPDERRGEVPALFVQAKVGTEIDLAEVENVCKKKLSRFKVPKKYYVVDSLPKTKNRKPDRKKLKIFYSNMVK